MTKTLLLDFDGPICGLFKGDVSSEDAARRLALDVGDLVPGTIDPFDILAEAIAAGRGSEASKSLATIEVEAAESAPATPGTLSLVANWEGSVGIVSSNHETAIRHWLSKHDAAVDVIVGRWPPRMKPDPWPLLTAAWQLSANPEHCLYVGDQLSDWQAAQASGIPFIGFATKPSRLADFKDAGCVDVIEDMRQLIPGERNQ